MRNTLFILAALGIGLFFPDLGNYNAVIRPNLMLMLFLSFIKAELSWEMFRPRHLLLALPSVALALAAFYGVRAFNLDLALNLFLIFLAPAAIVTPVLVDLLRRDVPYAIGGVLVTHAVWGLLIAFLLPPVAGFELSFSELANLLFQVAMTLGLPLLLALIWQGIGGRLLSFTLRLGRFSLYIFIGNILIASGRLSQYLRYEASVAPVLLLQIAAGVVLGGILLFILGYALGRRGWRPEASLLVGRKNTMLSIWIALAYLTPVITIGPMVYILLQNVLFAGLVGWWTREEERTDTTVGEAAGAAR